MTQLSLFELAPAPALLGNPILAARFHTWADALEPKIEYAGREMTQNPTPKRNREYQSRLHDCRNLERLQKALRALANGHQQGSIDPVVEGLRSKDEIARLVRKYIDGSKGGYYSCIESDDYAEKTPQARLLQGMINGSAAQRLDRDRLRKIGELEAAIALQRIPGYFPTPAPVVNQMLDRARLADGMMVLEPSAGSGNIADAIKVRHRVTLHAIEPYFTLRELLTLKGHVLVANNIMETELAPVYDRVVMNPPFEKQADLDHIRKAFTMLRPGGVLVSILAPSFEFRQDRKSIEFRAWLDEQGAEWETLPEGSFKSSGTGVSTRMVVIEKAGE